MKMRLVCFYIFLLVLHPSLKAIPFEYLPETERLSVTFSSPETIHPNTLRLILEEPNFLPENLKHLQFSCNFELTPEHWEALNLHLIANIPLLTTLHFEGMAFSPNTLTGIFSTCSEKQVAGLYLESLMHFNMPELALGIANQSCDLDELSLTNYEIDRESLALFSRALIDNTSLSCLSLCNIGMASAEFNTLFNALLWRNHSHQIYTDLNLSQNLINQITLGNHIFHQLPRDAEVFFPNPANRDYHLFSLPHGSANLTLSQYLPDGTEVVFLTLNFESNPISIEVNPNML